MKEISISKGYVATVDDSDYEMLNVFKWSVSEKSHSNYAYRKSDGKSCYMHMMILQYDRPFVCDHIDGNGLNNRRSNLRIVLPRQNSQNMHGRVILHRPGVVKQHAKLKKPWWARIKIGDRRVSLGCYQTESEAYAAYCNACDRVDTKIY